MSGDDFNEMIGRKVFPKTIIDDVKFDGPVHLPADILDELVDSIKQRESSIAISTELEETAEVSVRGAWQNHGYFNVRVSWEAIPTAGDADYQHFSVVFHVDEGPQYRLGKVQFRAAHFVAPTESGDRPSLRRRRKYDDPDPADLPIFPIEQLRSLIPLQEGDLLSSDKIREGLDALRKLYGSHGYIDFTPTPETEVDDEHQTVSIVFVLDEQPQYRIGKIEVAGLGPNTENALVWRLKPGDIFNYDLFKQFFEDNQSILPAGASPSENSEFRRNTKDGIVDIKLKFRPCPS
ncbi:MAG: POTRA domain-containing protein [Candidatus Acidiferrales bacterium]